MVVAVPVALPGSRETGLILDAVIVAAVVLTVLRHREFTHLVPLSVFVDSIALAETVLRADIPN